MNLPKELTKVTPLSKALALLMFISLPIIAFLFGKNYQQKADVINSFKKTSLPENFSQVSNLNKYNDWKYYKNDKFEFIFSYPTDWELKSSDSSNITLTKQQKSGAYKRIIISDTGIHFTSLRQLFEIFSNFGTIIGKPTATQVIDGRYGSIVSFANIPSEYIFIPNDNHTIHKFEFSPDHQEDELRKILATFHFLSNESENDIQYWNGMGTELGVSFQYPKNWSAEINDKDKTMKFYLMKDIRDGNEDGNKLKEVFEVRVIRGGILDEILDQYHNPKKITIAGQQAIRSNNVVVIQVNKSSLLFLEAKSMEGFIKLDKILSTIRKEN